MSSNNNNFTVSTSPRAGEGSTAASNSPRSGQCLCSPTTHEGSFRCRIHRFASSPAAAWMKRSHSMPANRAFSPKSVDSST
ncbi:serine-rich protein-related [Euphorbia peplus]|nr:serine-rich protein-related [Euphorbia peplus]